MKRIFIPLVIIISVVTVIASTMIYDGENLDKKKTFHDFVVKTIDGDDYNLSDLKGKKVLVVNVASKCGLTPQYKILQELYERLDKSKFEIIGFPANNFLKQEPGSNEEIAEFCQKNYGVSFPIMEKVSVCDYIYQSYPPDTAKAIKTNTDDIYKWLTRKEENGLIDTVIEWNFQKFLIDENGELIGTLSPRLAKEILLLKEWFGCSEN